MNALRLNPSPTKCILLHLSSFLWSHTFIQVVIVFVASYSLWAFRRIRRKCLIIISQDVFILDVLRSGKVSKVRMVSIYSYK